MAEIEQELIVHSTRKAELVTRKAKLEDIMSTSADGKSPKKLKLKMPKK